MKLYDGSRILEIRMVISDIYGFSPDFSADFFDAGNLKYDENNDAYCVYNCEYCLEQAHDWKFFKGDFANDYSGDLEIRHVYFKMEEM